MSRFYNNGKGPWAPRPENVPTGGRRGLGRGRRDSLPLHRFPADEEPESHHRDEGRNDDPLGSKLDRLIEQFDSWKDETERRFESLQLTSQRDVDRPTGYEEEDDADWGELNRGKYGERSAHPENPKFVRDVPPEGRGQRGGLGRDGRRGEQLGDRTNRRQYGHPLHRSVTCWDPPQRSGYDQPHQVKMTPPRFDGTNAANWISRAHYYFDHILMPDAQRMHYAVMLFDPPAADWVFNYCANNDFVTWQDFLEDVRHRFDRQSFKDYYGLIAKLTQTGSVLEYHDTFEKYLNRLRGVSESDLFTLFVAGLKANLQERLRLHRPQSLAEAMSLAMEFGDEQADRGPPAQHIPTQRRQWQNRDGRPSSGSASSQPSTQPLTSAGSAQGQSGRAPIDKKLPLILVSQAEKAERRRLGLCYHCPEKWVIGHVCTQRLLCYADDDEEMESDALDEHAEETTRAESVHINLMQEDHRSRPLRIVGSIQDRDVSILIDTGSDRDFLHPAVAEQLHIPLSPIRPFKVFVGNGDALLCTHMAKQTKLEVQGTMFLVDLHILPVHGPDIILGMDWLESLGKVTADFVGKTLEFTKGDKPITLRGILPPPRRVSLHSLVSWLPSKGNMECYEILLLAPGEPPQTTAMQLDFPSDLPPGVAEVLHRFGDVFGLPEGMPLQRAFDHRIHLLPGSRPVNVNVRPYRYPYFQKNEIERQVREMLDQGIIQRSSSPFSSPVLLIRKKDGTFRFCIDYRALNRATVPDHFPIPTADELFDELGNARFFTKLDLRSGYHQIRMHEGDVYKTAFRTHDGHFEFLVMPFGLTNAPSTFQAAMNTVFQPMLRKFVIVFFDDILVYSASQELHSQHLASVLSVLQKHKFFVKMSKCSFCNSSVEYLGHFVNDGMLKADPSKIEAMTAWPTPLNVKQLRGFLGLTGYYRRFIAHYALIAAPLTDLLKKDSFAWSHEAEKSFGDLKAAMTTAPVLRLPDFGLPFCIETDASDTGIGAVLLQENRPIAFFSKKLGPRRRVASTYHKELYAIVEAVQKWRQYLLGREFVIRSDQKSLKELLLQVVQTPDQQFYIRKLMGYKFSIEYKKGSLNKVAARSRTQRRRGTGSRQQQTRQRLTGIVHF